jgi:acetylornithine deacetylase/succinyl-diaminopimelate desuccinylase-like protein
VGEYVFDYLNRFSWLKVTKQVVAPGRFNVLARTAGRPRLMLAGHMDTVVPKEGWSRNQFAGEVDGDKLYGLGAYDMKGGVAAILSALSVGRASSFSGLSLLFYCDEEYGFRGMKTFLNQAPAEPRPGLVLIAEPSNLKIWNTHRGLIELHMEVGGTTGHAANPAVGVNAIAGLQKVLYELSGWVAEFRTNELGSSSLNIAFLRGGLNRGCDQAGMVLLGRDGNNIADYAEAVIDIRPARPELRAGQVTDELRRLIAKGGMKLVNLTVRHDLGALYTDPCDLRVVADVSGGAYLDASTKGYGDGQLIQEAWQVPVAYLGPSGGNAHALNEWVDISSLRTLAEMYSMIIQRYCSR